MTTTARYLIRATFHRFEPDYSHSPRIRYFGRHFGEHGFDPAAPLIVFADKDAARAAIVAADSKPYELGSNEHSRPTLRAVQLKCAPEAVILEWFDGGCL